MEPLYDGGEGTAGEEEADRGRRRGERERAGEIATQLNNSFGFRQANQTSLSAADDDDDVWKEEERRGSYRGHY